MTVIVDLKGHVALVTGAAGDIGGACAEQLATAGASVVLHDLAGQKSQLDDRARRCRDLGAGDVHTVTFDVTDPADVDHALDAVGGNVGPIDLLANVAGYQGAFTPFGDYPLDDAARVMSVNVVGLMAVSQAVVRGLRDAGRPGAIVSLASMAGVGGAANMSAYSASKAAVIGFTKAASRDLAPLGIRINCVSPAFIGPGYMWDRQVALQADTPSQYYSDDVATVEQEMIDQVPLRRLGTVDEVAAAVTWLLSDGASYVTGENIIVSGGIV